MHQTILFPIITRNRVLELLHILTNHPGEEICWSSHENENFMTVDIERIPTNVRRVFRDTSDVLKIELPDRVTEDTYELDVRRANDHVEVSAGDRIVCISVVDGGLEVNLYKGENRELVSHAEIEPNEDCHGQCEGCFGCAWELS